MGDGSSPQSWLPLVAYLVDSSSLIYLGEASHESCCHLPVLLVFVHLSLSAFVFVPPTTCTDAP